MDKTTETATTKGKTLKAFVVISVVVFLIGAVIYGAVWFLYLRPRQEARDAFYSYFRYLQDQNRRTGIIKGPRIELILSGVADRLMTPSEAKRAVIAFKALGTNAAMKMLVECVWGHNPDTIVGEWLESPAMCITVKLARDATVDELREYVSSLKKIRSDSDRSDRFQRQKAYSVPGTINKLLMMVCETARKRGIDVNSIDPPVSESSTRPAPPLDQGTGS